MTSALVQVLSTGGRCSREKSVGRGTDRSSGGRVGPESSGRSVVNRRSAGRGLDLGSTLGAISMARGSGLLRLLSLVVGGLFPPFALGMAVIGGLAVVVVVSVVVVVGAGPPAAGFAAGSVGAPVGIDVGVALGAAPASISAAVAITLVSFPSDILVSALTSRQIVRYPSCTTLVLLHRRCFPFTGRGPDGGAGQFLRARRSGVVLLLSLRRSLGLGGSVPPPLSTVAIFLVLAILTLILFLFAICLLRAAVAKAMFAARLTQS